MWRDPIIEEIHRIRETYAEKFDYDLNAIFEDLRRLEHESGRRVVSFPPRPAISTQLGPRPAAPEAIYQIAEPAVAGVLRESDEDQAAIPIDDQSGEER